MANLNIGLILIVGLPLIFEYPVCRLDSQLWLRPTYLDNYLLSSILREGLTSSEEIMSSPVAILWFLLKIHSKALDTRVIRAILNQHDLRLELAASSSIFL